MTKQEKIKEAYGEHWEQVKEFVDENGWIYLESLSNIIYSEPVEFDDKGNYWRPKTLQGIETNLGWIKIESEADLPELETFAWVIDSRRNDDFKQILIPRRESRTKYWTTYATHYQPIIKPQSPIY